MKFGGAEGFGLGGADGVGLGGAEGFGLGGADGVGLGRAEGLGGALSPLMCKNRLLGRVVVLYRSDKSGFGSTPGRRDGVSKCDPAAGTGVARSDNPRSGLTVLIDVSDSSEFGSPHYDAATVRFEVLFAVSFPNPKRSG
jgi:hypothetical protein